MKQFLHNYRLELLLIALLLLLFDKAFFTNDAFFTKYVWPFNMVILGVASFGIFKERNNSIKLLKNTLFVSSILIPIFFSLIIINAKITQLSFVIYIAYYFLIFIEILRQIFQKAETNLSVVFGSVSGYLLLVVIAQFTYLLIEYNVPNSFSGLEIGSIPKIYNQLSYFSMVTLSTVGFGDIAPLTDTARLGTMFFTISGQFYMVALVGIIISRFNSK